jgi:hypothetical protein
MEAPSASPSSKYESTNSVDASHSTVDPNAPPAYGEDASENNEGSSRVRRMSKRDYAIEISRMMGKQLVKSVNGNTSVKEA